MRLFHASSRLAMLCIAVAIAAGCSMTPSASPLQNSVARTNSRPAQSDADAGAVHIKTPALLFDDSTTGALEYWPIVRGGSSNPTRISQPGIFHGLGMVANGRVVSFANDSPNEVVTFDVRNQHENTLPDPYGTPFDIAIGKDASLYVINDYNGRTNVAIYPGGAPRPRELSCRFVSFSQQIAVDNEGDIFLNGIESTNSIGVVEIPNGPNGPEPQKCKELNGLQPETANAGIAVDPKTDALIVLSNPDECAGGEEGRMTIYPKPYRARTAIVHDIGENCSWGLRLSGDSKLVFVHDEDVSGSHIFVLQRSYPDGRRFGTYHGPHPSSFTTIPNTLPN